MTNPLDTTSTDGIPQTTATSVAASANSVGRYWLLAVLLLALVVRGLFAWLGPNHFQDDQDAYLVLAQGIASGHGLCVPGSNKPTAYRPPLYPIMLALTRAPPGKP